MSLPLNPYQPAIDAFNSAAHREWRHLSRGIADAFAKRDKHLEWHHEHPAAPCLSGMCDEPAEGASTGVDQPEYRL